MTSKNDQIKSQVEAEFEAMETALATSHPGILDVLEVYGNYEDAIRQARLYLNSLEPNPLYTTTDRSDF